MEEIYKDITNEDHKKIVKHHLSKIDEELLSEFSEDVNDLLPHVIKAISLRMCEDGDIELLDEIDVEILPYELSEFLTVYMPITAKYLCYIDKLEAKMISLFCSNYINERKW